MSTDANQYDSVAHLYDAYVRSTVDLDFFRELVDEREGLVLDLMCGTGRVATALRSVVDGLVCIDLSVKMLTCLQRKMVTATPSPLVICGDARALPLTNAAVGTALLPFNSFSEILDPSDRFRTLQEVVRCLKSNGVFVCTLHNPQLRARTLDGIERLQGSYRIPSDPSRTLELRVTGSLDRATGEARSKQRYCIVDSNGRLREEQNHTVRFVLIEPDSLSEMAWAAGLSLLDLYGNYDKSGFESESSPFMISVWRRD